jgi:DNA ligase (NAD+)
MSFKKMYEKMQGMVALEIFEYSRSSFESEFKGEMLELNNMNKGVFSKSSEEEQFEILRLYDAYFRIGVPLIEDSLYDTFLSVYDKDRESTSPIMFEPSISAWKKVKHDIPMGSLDKASTIEEIEKWNMKPIINTAPKVISEKLDGISLEVIYEKGKFVKAVTRGDGVTGDDITENAKYFDGMVKELGETWDCAIRGEVMITKDNLNTINTILISEGKDPLKNTRNGVSGQATKYKDRNEEILQLITFIAYDVQIFKVYETGENVV